MNCPSRVDDIQGHDGYNQSPPFLPADLTTKADLNSIMDLKRRIDVNKNGLNTFEEDGIEDVPTPVDKVLVGGERRVEEAAAVGVERKNTTAVAGDVGSGGGGFSGRFKGGALEGMRVLKKFGAFVGPGFMISVSYMDPGNYSTDVAGGAQFKFHHLFVILLSNLFAIFLQALCVKLGSVTGMDLAQNCKAHLPRWLNYILYFLAECAIIATDIAEVIGSAIALNILLKIPLVAGVAITSVDVFIVLFFYRADGPVRNIRFFEIFVAVLVFGVIVCFSIELAKLPDTSAGEVLRGYLPSKAIASGEGLYLSCGILGATVMPHSLYLGSGIVQARLKEFDIKEGTYHSTTNLTSDTESEIEDYRPSVSAIQSTMKYCVADVAISLLTCALFANSAILIVSGATLYNTPRADSADLFSIHDLLSNNLGKAAGTIFALALFFSGESAGIVVTLAGQMISEGFLDWRLKPWIRRSITRGIAILPSMVVAASIGRSGLSEVLNASQVVLSILLPFVSAPLLYFTCRAQYMRVVDHNVERQDGEGQEAGVVDMSNGWLLSGVSVAVWTFIAALNMYLIVTLASGKN